MKADWDDVRDTAIGELSPAELGASYAFISNWQSFWKVHGHKDLEALRTWSRIQVEAIWSGHLSGEFRGTHTRLEPTTALGSVKEGHNSNVSQEHKFYTQAWALCSGALTESSRKPIAFKGLAEIEKRHPILAPHIEYLRKRLT